MRRQTSPMGIYSYHSPPTIARTNCCFTGDSLPEAQGTTSAEHFCYDSMRPKRRHRMRMCPLTARDFWGLLAYNGAVIPMSTEEKTMPVASVNGIDLYYEVSGTGFPLVL